MIHEVAGVLLKFVWGRGQMNDLVLIFLALPSWRRKMPGKNPALAVATL